MCLVKSLGNVVRYMVSVEVSSEAYELLVEVARRRGRSIEEVMWNP